MQGKLVIAAAGLRLNVHLKTAGCDAIHISAEGEAPGCCRACRKTSIGSCEIQVSDAQAAAAGLGKADREIEDWGTAAIRIHQRCRPVPVDVAVVGIRSASGQEQGDSKHGKRPKLFHKASTGLRDELRDQEWHHPEPGYWAVSAGDREHTLRLEHRSLAVVVLSLNFLRCVV